jgi:hypothetical protein
MTICSACEREIIAPKDSKKDEAIMMIRDIITHIENCNYGIARERLNDFIIYVMDVF